MRHNKESARLVPATEFAQEHLGVATRLRNVVHNGRAAEFARIIYEQVAEAKHTLWDGCRDGHILNIAQGNVASAARE